MNNRQKQRKDQKRKKRAKKRVLARRNFLRATRKLDEELEQIKKMQEDAEKYAEEDNKRKEEIETVNHAEQMVYQTKKTFEENKDKVDQAKVGPIMVKISELEELLKAEKRDVEKIKSKMDEINKDAQGVFAEMYAKAGANPEAETGASGSKDDVVDTEATEKK